MRMHLKRTCILAVALCLASCGAKTNSKTAVYTNMLLERQCALTPTTREQVSDQISLMFMDFNKRYPVAFLTLPPRSYDYKNPLIISIKAMSQELARLKEEASEESTLQAKMPVIAVDLYYLYVGSLRYESQKCSFSYLATKMKNDIRPYLEMRDFCVDKTGSEICSVESLSNLTTEESAVLEEKSVKMCKSFDASAVNCQTQMMLTKKSHRLSELLSYYQKRFQKEQFEKLFRLRNSHLKFSCQKIENDVTQMTVKVYSREWDAETLLALTSSVGASWSKNNFHLNVEIVNAPGNGVVEIFNITGGISYVPDNDNRKLYLSSSLDFETRQRTIAHEFGHVLGFPDCYSEFYDGQNKDLIYFEMGEENTNIMCSLRTGVSVPNDYALQLAQNSCVFN